MASTSKVYDQSDDNTAEELSTLNSDSDTDLDCNGNQSNSAKNSDGVLKTENEPEDSKSEKQNRKLKSRRRRKLKRRESTSLNRTNSVDTFNSEKSGLSTESKKLRKRKQQKVNKFFIDPNGAIERKLEQKYVELEELLNRQFVERKTNLTHLHIGQMEVLRQQYNLPCHGLPPTGVKPYTEGPRRRPHSAHHTTPAWEGESDEAYSAIRQIQQMSKFPGQKRKVRSKSAKSRRETYSDNESHRQNVIDINRETASLSSARSPRSRTKRGTSSDNGSQRESTSPSVSPSRGYIPTDNQLRDTDNRRIKEWLRKKNIELRKQRAVERAEKKEKRKESILKENEKIIARETGRSKVEEWMNQKRREAIEHKKAERLRHRQLEEEQKEREAKKKMEFVQGKSWMRPASAPVSRSKGKGFMASSSDEPSTSTDSQSSRPVPHPPSSKLMYKRTSAGRVRLRARSSEKVKGSDTETRPPTEKSLESSQLTYSEWLEKKRVQDAQKKAATEAKTKATAKSDSDLENLLPDLHKKRVNKVLKSKKRVDSGMRSDDETQTSQDAESPVETFLTVSGAKAELTTRNSYPRPQSAKLPSPQPCKSPKRPKSAHPRVDAILDEEEKEENQENPFHLPFPAHLGLPKEVAKTQSKVFPDRTAAERKSITAETAAVDEESNALAVQEINVIEEQIDEDIPEEPEDKVEQIEEESPRVGASFFKTDPEEEVGGKDIVPVNVEPPPTIQEIGDASTSFLDNSQEKLEPDKSDQKLIGTENQNGNNNNIYPCAEITPDVVPGGEVNITELPSEKIPIVEVNDNDIPQEVIDYKEDIFMMDSDEEEEEIEEAEENVDSEQQVVEDQHDANKNTISTDEDNQQTIAGPGGPSDVNRGPENDSSVEQMPKEENELLESQYEIIKEESELIDKKSEPFQDSVEMTEHNAAPEPQGEHAVSPISRQEAGDKPDLSTHRERRECTNTLQEADDKEDDEDPMSQHKVDTTQEADTEDLDTQQKEDTGEDSVTHQEIDVTEEIEEEIEDETVSDNVQYFLDKRQSKHEPDKLEFLEQVMDSLPDVDDDSKGETSSLDGSIKPDKDGAREETLDQSGKDIPNNASPFYKLSQKTIKTEQNEVSIEEEVDNINELPKESFLTHNRDGDISLGQHEKVSNEITDSDTQQQYEGHSNLQEHNADQITNDSPGTLLDEEAPKLETGESISETERPITSSKPKPLTPTLGRHLSSDELLANIQAGKKLISIPYSSDENEDYQQTQSENGTPAEKNTKDEEQICINPPSEQVLSQEMPMQITQLVDQDVHSRSELSNELDQEGELDANIINEQKQLKLVAVDQIGQKRKDSLSSVQEDKVAKEADKVHSEGFDIPIEVRKDAEAIQEQKDLKEAALDAIANVDLEDKTFSSNSIQIETNTDLKISPIDNSDPKTDNKIIKDQETSKAEMMEELNDDSHKSHYTQLNRNPEKNIQEEEAPQSYADDYYGVKDSHIDNIDADSVIDHLSYIRSSDDNDKAADANTEDAQTNIESEEEMLNNLHERLQKLRSYDDDEFSALHQNILHKPATVSAHTQDLETPDMDTETDTSYQSPNSTPELEQGSNSKDLSDSFKRGLQLSTHRDCDKVGIDDNGPHMSTEVENDQPIDSQTDFTKDLGQTEITEEITSTEIPDNQCHFYPSGQDSLDQHQNGFDTAVIQESVFSNEEPSVFENSVSSNEVNNNKEKPDDQTVLNNHNKIIESLSSMKESIDQTNRANGDVSIDENDTEQLKNLENEFNLVPDNRHAQDETDVNDNIKPILSSRDDNDTNDSQSSRQKKVSFSNRHVIIQENVSQSEIDTDSDAVDDVLRTML